MSRAKELATKYKTLLNNNGINTTKRLAMFFAQLDHESGLKPISENLNYSSQGLIKTFPKYFTKDNASLYEKQPQKIANKVYSSRMGNGTESSGDGWKYRGRGFIQLTGKNNYTMLSTDTRIDFVSNPDLLLEEANAMISALWYWNKNNLNKYSDNSDVKGATKVINGAYNGLLDRENKYKRYLVELK